MDDDPASVGPPPDTATTPARAGAIALVSDMAGQGIKLVASVLVANQLGPDDFSAWALLSVFIAACIAIDEGGLHQTLVVTPRWTRRQGSATFWVSALIGLALFVAVPLIGGLVDASSGSLVPYLVVFCVTVLTSTFTIVPRASLVAALDFRRISSREVVARALSSVVMVLLAVSIRSVWALLAGVVLQRLLEHILLFQARPYLPSWPPHIREFRPLMGFTVPAMGATVLGFISTQAGTVVTAAMLSTAALGTWGLAMTIFVTAQSRIAVVLSKVALPSFVRISGDRRVASYLRALRLTTSVLTPLVCLMALLTPFLVGFVLGDEWNDLVPVAALLVPAGVARGIGPLTEALINAERRSSLNLRWELIRLPVSVVLTVAGAALWGVVGVAAASGPLLALGVTVRLVFLRGHLKMDVSSWLRSVAMPMLAAVIASAVAVVPILLLGNDQVIGAVATAAAFLAVYGFLIRLLMPATLTDWLGLIGRSRSQVSLDS